MDFNDMPLPRLVSNQPEFEHTRREEIVKKKGKRGHETRVDYPRHRVAAGSSVALWSTPGVEGVFRNRKDAMAARKKAFKRVQQLAWRNEWGMATA